MAAGKEIRGKIKSVENTKEDHQSHGNGGSASKMQGAGPHARRPPWLQRKVRNIAANLGESRQSRVRSPFMRS